MKHCEISPKMKLIREHNDRVNLSKDDRCKECGAHLIIQSREPWTQDIDIAIVECSDIKECGALYWTELKASN